MNGSSKENGWGEFFLPLQALEVGSIVLHEPRFSYNGSTSYSQDRLLASLSYKTNFFTLPILSILTPLLKVNFWDSSTGRLDLELEPESITAIKIEALQESLIKLLLNKPQWLMLGGTKTKEEIQNLFQPILTGNILTIYLHGPNPEKKNMSRVWVWKSDTWQKGVSSSTFKKGQQVRIALRFQGICFLPMQGGKTRYRLQHQTVAVYLT